MSKTLNRLTQNSPEFVEDMQDGALAGEKNER